MEKKTKQATETFKAAGETQKKATLTGIEAAADMGAQFDRMVRAQLGHATAAQKTASEFVTQSFETSLKAQEAIRKASVELAQAAFA